MLTIKNLINIIYINKYQKYYSSNAIYTKHQIDLMARGLPKQTKLNGVKKIIIIASGKGGVGKSTTSVNLAVTLAQMGKRIGLLDADVFGPTIPLMMNVNETPLINRYNLMIPPMNYGIKCISMGLLIDKIKPIIWRGPLVMSAVQRLLKGTYWSPLDILIIDTPPGTGDVHLSLSQNTHIDGILLVSTPQATALNVTVRGAEMYKTLKIPIIGLIENMSNIICTNCNTEIKLFNNVTAKYVTDFNIDILERLPIIPDMAECCDNGIPLVIKQTKSKYSLCYQSLAEKVLHFLNSNNKS